MRNFRGTKNKQLSHFWWQKSLVVIIWRGVLPHLTNMVAPPKAATDYYASAVTLMDLTLGGSRIFIAFQQLESGRF